MRYPKLNVNWMPDHFVPVVPTSPVVFYFDTLSLSDENSDFVASDILFGKIVIDDDDDDDDDDDPYCSNSVKRYGLLLIYNKIFTKQMTTF